MKYLEESLTSLINLTASDNQLAFQEKLNEIKSFFSKNATQTLTGGQKLNLLHRELKKEQLRNKAGLFFSSFQFKIIYFYLLKQMVT